MTLVSRTYWDSVPFDFRAPPERARVEPVFLRTDDRRALRGLWWAPEASGVGRSPRVAVVLMHPRVDFTRHYTIPRLVAAGIGVLACNSRHPNDGTDTVHEELLLDVARCVRHARFERGADAVVLLGSSGGGSLMSFYLSQACLPGEERIARTPDGAPARLPKAELPDADALILIAAHRGEGHVLAQSIDPSVIDERDPLLVDPGLDMYAEHNGFRPPPEWSEYSEEFASRYRLAQLDRIRRLDAIAKGHIAVAARARRDEKHPRFESLPFSDQQSVLRAKHARHVMVVYRTMANLSYVDHHLDPSPRAYGSLLSERPDLMSYAYPGFARTITPRAWLSTWSALSSNADMTQTLPRVRKPVLMVSAGKDREIFPRADLEPIRDAITSEDRTFAVIADAGHYFEPEPGQTHAPHVEELMELVVPWITARFGG
ncbi:MAG: hypothetical protein K8H88_12290 [Sandaracinaceae bacterium]|nr:hypothetical protein [Sandaracinaceae bacterium]